MQLLGNINYGKALILINRNDYFQAGLIIRKGSFEEIQKRRPGGISKLRFGRLLPTLASGHARFRIGSR